LQKYKLDDQDLSSIDANRCALKPNANATQKIKIKRLIQRLEDYLD